MAISNGGQCPQLNSGLGTSHGWLSSMWIERSDTLIHALGYNTTLFAGQSEGWYVLILVPKKLEDFETFNAVLQRGAGPWVLLGTSHKVALVLGGCERYGASVGLRWMLGPGRGCTKGHRD